MLIIAALIGGFLIGATAIMVFASLAINDTSFYRKEAAFYKKHAQDWEQQAKDWKQLFELVQSTKPNPDDPEKSEQADHQHLDAMAYSLAPRPL